MEAREIKQRFEGIMLTHEDYCALVEWLGYPEIEENGMSGRWPGYHWETMLIEDEEINIYWL